MPEPTATVTGVASTALLDLLTGPVRAGYVIGASPAAAYLVFPTTAASRLPVPDAPPLPVVALEARHATGLPNALGLTDGPSHGLPGRLASREPAEIGDGRCVLGDTVVRVGRWRDPRPRLGAVEVDALLSASRRAASLVPAPVDELTAAVVALAGDLEAAAADRDAAGARAVARRMLGFGLGATPSGDDVLAGFVAAGRLLAATRGATDLAIWFADLGTHAVTRATRRTTALSAALLWHAQRGEVAVPAGALLHALAGTGDVSAATASLLEVGHRSGADLTLGILAAARVVAGAPSAATTSGAAHARTR